MNMQVLITAAGLGTRSGLNGRLRKEMLPVYECIDGRLALRPLLEVIVNRYRGLGIKDFVIVLNRKDERTLSYVREFMDFTTVAFQDHASGFGDAVYCAREYITGDFILNCGDGIYLDREYLKLFVSMAFSSKEILLSLMRVDDPKRYGVAEIIKEGDRNIVLSVAEKPSSPKSDLAIMAMYRFPHEIMEIMGRMDDRKELTPAIGMLISEGKVAEALIGNREMWLSVGMATEYLQVLGRSRSFLESCNR